MSLAASTLLGVSATAQESAAQLLARSFQRTFGANIVAIILQKDATSESFQRVKVERNRQGVARCTILQPLRYSGMASVDDGERLQTYLPDRRMIVDQESPGKAACDIDERIALAKKNYLLRVVPAGKIAGRDTLCVEAKPKVDDLEVRRYYLDSQTYYPLRLETMVEGNEINVVFDTKDISFPKQLDSRQLAIEAAGDVYVQRFQKPTKVMSGAQAQKLVGFVPLVPNGLPMGFKVQELQFCEDGKWKPIVIKLTDGLARATLYEWDADENVKVQSFSNSSLLIDKKSGLKLMIVSDLSPAVRLQLLKAFIAESAIDPALRAQRIFGMFLPVEAGLQSSLELITSVWAFSGIESLSGIDSVEPAMVGRIVPPNG